MSASIDFHLGIVTTESGRRDTWPSSPLTPVANLNSGSDTPIDTRPVVVAAGSAEQVYDYTEQEQGFMLLGLWADKDLDVVVVTGTPATGSLTPANLTASVQGLRANVPLVLNTDRVPTMADPLGIAGVDVDGVPLVLSSEVLDGRVYSVWVRNRGTTTAKVRVARRG